MKKMKKFLAMLLAMVMVMGMSVTVFAAPETSNDNVSVKGIENEIGLICKNTEEGHTHNPDTCYGSLISVKAYQIICYDDRGFYKEIIDNTITKGDKITTVDGKDVLKLVPSATDIQSLFREKLNQLTVIKEFERTTDGSYIPKNGEKLDPGTWMVVVSGSDKYLYNPAIISVNKTPEGTVYGTLNLETDTWASEVGDTPLYLKRDEPKIEKSAESASTVDGRKDPVVTGTQYGDILKFTIKADVPSYMTNTINIQYSIEDKLTGLSLVNDKDETKPKYAPTGTITGGKPEDSQTLDEAVKAAVENGKDYFIVTNLANDFLIRNANKEIIITYYAKVTSTELINVDQLNNTAKLSYSTNDTDRVRTKESETKHYTFGLDTSVTGTIGSGTQNKTGEFIKINDKGDISYSEKNEGEVAFETEVKPLDGAAFQLHVETAEGKLFKDKLGKDTFTTDKTGRLEIAGLDDNVDYYLVETKAPNGYSLNTTPVKVHINATYDKDNNLTGYSVTIGANGEEAVTHYTYNVTEGKTTILNGGKTSNPYGFKNTTLATLPSTGGIGTTIFTIGGCAIMILAAGLYFMSRRKSAK